MFQFLGQCCSGEVFRQQWADPCCPQVPLQWSPVSAVNISGKNKGSWRNLCLFIVVLKVRSEQPWLAAHQNRPLQPRCFLAFFFGNTFRAAWQFPFLMFPHTKMIPFPCCQGWGSRERSKCHGAVRKQVSEAAHWYSGERRGQKVFYVFVSDHLYFNQQ